MKKNFFKLMLLGAFTMTLGLVGCNKYDKDIEDICKRLNTLETDIAQIKADLEKGGYVESVTLKSGTTNVLLIKYAGQATPVELTIAGDGDGGSEITKDGGFWVFDGEKTNYPVAGLPRINPETGYWQFAGADGTYADSKYHAGGAFYTVDGDGQYVLHIMNATGGAYTEIVLEKASGAAGVTRVEILGWVTELDDAITDGRLQRITLANRAQGEGNNEVQGELLSDDEPFIVNYSIVAAFTYDHLNTALTDGEAPSPAADHNKANLLDFLYTTKAARTNPPVSGTDPAQLWKAGVAGKEVKQGSVNNTLAADRQGILVQVFPATEDISLVKFAIKNTLGSELPIGFGTPEPLDDVMLTRAASANGLWFIPGANYTGTQSFAGEEARADFGMEFKDQALYQLFGDGKLLSDVTDFTIKSRMVASVEAPVDGVKTGDVVVNATPVAAPGTGNEYEVEVSSVKSNNGTGPLIKKWYSLNFGKDMALAVNGANSNAPGAPTAGAPDYAGSLDSTLGDDWAAGTEAVSDAVTDYYMETVSGTVDPQLWGIEFQENNTQFMTGKLSDNLTLTNFDMNVYKLGVDGKVYLETVKIHPVRQEVITTINLGEYPIYGRNTTAFLGDSLKIDLTRAYESNRVAADGYSDADVPPAATAAGTAESMFTELSRYMWDTELTYEQFWKDEQSIVGRGASSHAIVAAQYQVGAAAPVVLTTAQITAYQTAGLNFYGFDAAGVATTDVENIRKFEVSMPYAITNGTAPAWVVDAVYTITIEFYDANSNPINKVKVLFTPTVPDPDALYRKNPARWSDDNSTLYAYYTDPIAKATGNLYLAEDGTRYDIALGSYQGNATSIGAGGDGGFYWFADGLTFEIKKLTDAAGVTTDYAVATDAAYVTYGQGVATAGSTKYDPWTYTGAATPANDMVFDLRNQYIPAGDMTETAGIDVDGDGTAGAQTTLDVPIDLVRMLDPDNAVLAATPYDVDYYGGDGINNQEGQNELGGTTLTVGVQSGYMYLGLYPYTDVQLANAEFNVQIMSALYEGDINAAGTAINLTPAGDYDKITADMIVSRKYSNVPYSLFQVYDAGGNYWEYSYIDKVEFFVPNGTNNVDELDYTTDYAIVDGTGASSTVAIAPTATEASYVRIQPLNTSQAVSAKIIVRVTDRFGKVKETMLPLNIAKSTNAIP